MSVNKRQFISIAAAALLLVSVLIANWFLALYQPADTGAQKEYLSKYSIRFVIVWLVILGLILILAVIAGIRKKWRYLVQGLSVILYQFLAVYALLSAYRWYWFLLPAALLITGLLTYYFVHKPVGRELLVSAVVAGTCVGIMRISML